MKNREALFALLAIALTVFGILGVAATGSAACGPNPYGEIVHAQSAGFDALAYRIFDGGADTIAILAAKSDFTK